ncbi:MAG TPA: LysR family transcriptional regulator [Jatrophihabitantaceae bacterium]|jgi:DNA-binding transcriptional LysR family regulator
MVSSRQLEYFQAVARELHFTRAARALHIAQPALSQQIRKLERQLGVDLFERNNHRVQLTPAGSALLAHAERILSDLAAVDEELTSWAHGVRGTVRLGTARALAAPLSRMLSVFCESYPDVDIVLREESTQAMTADLQAGRLDVATLAALPSSEDDRLSVYSLGPQPLVLIAGAATPLGRRRRVPLTALDGVDLVLYSPGSAVRDVIVSALATAGAQPRFRFETREYNTARALASSGLAAAILPQCVADEPGWPVAVVRLRPEPTWTPALTWSAVRRPTPALTAFLDFARTRLRL